MKIGHEQGLPPSGSEWAPPGPPGLLLMAQLGLVRPPTRPKQPLPKLPKLSTPFTSEELIAFERGD